MKLRLKGRNYRETDLNSEAKQSFGWSVTEDRIRLRSLQSLRFYNSMKWLPSEAASTAEWVRLCIWCHTGLDSKPSLAIH